MSCFRLINLAALVLLTSACASQSHRPDTESATGAIQATDADNATALSPEAQVAATPSAAQSRDGSPTPPPDSAQSVSESVFDTADDTAILENRIDDPWEGFNRRVYGFNATIDRFALRPLAIAYEKITPNPVQSSVTRFFDNLREPATAVNQTLQGRPVGTLQTMGRFAVNITIGIGGLFDPASHFGMPSYDEDFGQTLAAWGWHDSRYLVLPLLGPRTVRDSVGMVGDWPLSPIGYVSNDMVANGLNVLQLANARARILPMDDARAHAADEYALVRDTWVQHRIYKTEQDRRGSVD
jgi:phospholipid-binding lipoprotein MlaA